MCGRYLRRSDKQRIAEHFRISGDMAELHPSYNVAPTDFEPVVRLERETGERELTLMRWGMVPYWAKSPKDLGLSTINAKAESLLAKALWKDPLERRRCLVIADGFYEWQRIDEKNKQPYAFALKNDEPFAFAGIMGSVEAARRKLAHQFRHHHHRAERAHRQGSQPHARHRQTRGLQSLAQAIPRRAAAHRPLAPV